MNNLTAREKGFMYVITLLIIVVLGYFFGIRTLNKKYDEYKTELQTLQERKAYLDQLRENNASMASEIELLKASCSELELSFIDEIETECLEQYVLKTFETEGCPYLVSVSSADLGMSAVEYPDGTMSPDGLVCMQISVTYASTDGYTVTQYNRTPDFTNPNTVAQTITELEEQMGQGDYAKRIGYKEFITALKKINAENPSCIKVDSISVSQNGGALIMKAAINFYGANLRNRISVDESKKPYTYWCGNKNVDTKGGFIGFPYVCDNPNSLWYGIENTNFTGENGGSMPFAAYWATALFKQNFAEAGGSYRELLGFEYDPNAVALKSTVTPTPTPAPAPAT